MIFEKPIYVWTDNTVYKENKNHRIIDDRMEKYGSEFVFISK